MPWIVMTFLSGAVGLYALFLVATGFATLPEDVAANGVLAPYGLWVHIAASGLALLVGPWQFLPGLRAWRPRLHRTMGRIYVISALVGGGTGAIIALGTSSGLVAGLGFLALGVIWTGTTALAYRRVRAGDFAGHRRWMVRSFAAAFAAVTLRLYLGIGMGAGLEFAVVYPAVAWLCWVPNLLVAEAWIRRGRIV